ncbi:uncharacterized protein [Nicotiana tomentosiformis]|uniref:uncharacterized protein n=1 Tax=Nicotiana tomentosiformis TaxID=4098 RepID=UPI00388C4502
MATEISRGLGTSSVPPELDEHWKSRHEDPSGASQTLSVYKEISGGANATPATWKKFSEAFLRHYLPIETRRALLDQFLTLRDGGMSVVEYKLYFNYLAKFGLAVVSDMEDRVHKHYPKNLSKGNRSTGLLEIEAQAREVDFQGPRSDRPPQSRASQASWASGSQHRVHFMRDCPSRGGSDVAQPARPVVVSSAPARPQWHVPQTPGDHDLGSTLSYVTPFDASKVWVELETIKPFEVATPVGDLVVARCVFRGCTVVIGDRSTTSNLIELQIIDFDVILCMDWFSSCYANVECRVKTKMIAKGCLYHIVHVRDIDKGTSTLESVSVVNEFPNVFLDELPGLPPEWEIDFPINIVPGTQPISITPYKMAQAKLKEVEEHLRDILDKGFIRPRTSY